MQNSQKAVYAGVSISIKLKVAGWKWIPVLVHSSEFCEFFKNDCLVVNVRTAASGILGYPYVGISSTRSTLRKCTVFSIILVFIHFKLILESCTNSGVYLETFMMQKRSAIDIWQVLKYGSAASFFNTFSTFFLWILEWIFEHFFFWKCAATLLTRCKSKILLHIPLVPKLLALYWSWKYQTFIHL